MNFFDDINMEQAFGDMSMFFGSGEPCDTIEEYMQEFKNHCIRTVNEIVPTIEWTTPEMKTYSFILGKVREPKPNQMDNMIMYGTRDDPISGPRDLPEFTRRGRNAEEEGKEEEKTDEQKLEEKLDSLRFARVPCCCHSPWTHGYVDNAILSSFLSRLIYFKVHFDISVCSISVRAHFTAPHLAEVLPPAPLGVGARRGRVPHNIPASWIIPDEKVYEHHRLAGKLWAKRGAVFDTDEMTAEEQEAKFYMDEELMSMDSAEPLHNRPPFSLVWKEDCEQRLNTAFLNGCCEDLDFDNKRARNECPDARMMSSTKYIYPIAVFSTEKEKKIGRPPHSLMHLAAIASAEALMDQLESGNMTEGDLREVIESVPEFVVKYMYIRVVFRQLFVHDRWKTEEELKKDRSVSQTRKRARDVSHMVMCSLQYSTFSNFTVQRWTNLLMLQHN